MLHRLLIGKVVGHLRRDDNVETVVGKRQRAHAARHLPAIAAELQRRQIRVQTGHPPVPAMTSRPLFDPCVQPAVAGAEIQQGQPLHVLAAQPADQQALKGIGHQQQTIQPRQLAVVDPHFGQR